MHGLTRPPWEPLPSSPSSHSDEECLPKETFEDDEYIDKPSFAAPSRKSLVVHLAIIGLYTLILLVFIHVTGAKPSLCEGDVFSPARGAVIHEHRNIVSQLRGRSGYVGQPGKEMDDLWRQLLKYTNIRLQLEDLESVNRSSIPLSDKQGGYLAGLDMFHQLHCLNILRKQIYREHYPVRFSRENQLEHADHCIETLRQVLMCHGDVSVVTYRWIDDYRWPWPDFDATHLCRNWEAITDWAAQRSLPDLRGPILQHPKLGVSYRGGDANET